MSQSPGQPPNQPEQQGNQPVGATPPTPPQSSEDLRRKVHAALLGGTFGVAYAGGKNFAEDHSNKPAKFDPGQNLPAVPQPSAEKPREKPIGIDLSGAPSVEALQTGELSANWTRSYRRCYTELDCNHVALIDQNGIIIKIIEIPREILARSQEKDFKDTVFGPWIAAQRQAIKKEYPTVYLNEKEKLEEPTLVNIRTIFNGNLREKTSFLDVVWENSHKPVSKENSQSRYRFLKKKLAGSGLPESLQMIAMGLVGIESMYKDMPENSDKAAGAFQITRAEALIGNSPLMGSHKKEVMVTTRRGRKRRKKTIQLVAYDNRYDFDKASTRFIELFTDRYNLIKKNDHVKALCERFELTEKDIVYPLILNTYHSGVPRNVTGYTDREKTSKNYGKYYGGMCKWFLDNFKTQESIEPILGKGPYGEDVFNLMVSIYAQNEVDPGFKSASRSYYRRARGMAELLQLKETEQSHVGDPTKKVAEVVGGGEKYEPPAKRKSEAKVAHLQVAQPQPKTAQAPREEASLLTLPIRAGAAVGAIGYLAARAVDDTPLSRRQFVRGGVGTIFASAAASFFGGRSVKSAQKDETEQPPPPKPLPGRPESYEWKTPSRNDAVVRAALEEKLSRVGSLCPNAKQEDITALDISVLLAKLKDPITRGVEAATRRGFIAFDTVDQIAPNKKNQMHKVSLESPRLRLRGVGIAKDSDVNDNNPIEKQNDIRCAYLKLYALGAADRIAINLNEKLLAYGMPPQFKVRLVASSLSRSRDLHEKIRRSHPRYAAKGDSPHIFGHTFDLSRFKYDIIDTRTNTYYPIDRGSSEGSVENRFSLVRTINATLGRTLIEMREKGEILVIWEDDNPVYHITAL